MLSGNNSLNNKSFLPAVGLVVLFGAVLALILNLQVHKVTREQQQELGNTAVRQLAELAKLPLSRGDIISLQVTLDHLVSSSSTIARASAYDRNRKLLAQGGGTTHPDSPVINFERQVNFENVAIGIVQVVLVDPAGLPPFRNLILLPMLVWAVWGLGFLFWHYRQTAAFSHRLANLNRGLLACPEENRNMDELTLLETRIAPLITHANDDEPDSEPGFYCLVALCCHNLPRLKLQLSSEHFATLFRQLDDVIDHACELYEGQRLNTCKNCLVVRFAGHTGRDDYPLRALYFSRAVTAICQEWAPASGVPLELSMVLDSLEMPTADSHWVAGLALEQSIASLTDATLYAGPWEILLTQRVAEMEVLADCAEMEVLGGESGLARFRRLGEPQTNLLMRQVAFLQTQI